MKVPEEIIIDLVKNIAGSDTVKLLHVLLKARKNVSEFKIAEKLGISVNAVRNMIYRLQEYNLVSFTRKKDAVKGWYIYFWAFNVPKAVGLIEDMKKKSIEKNEYELENIENTRLYICKPCRSKIKEEEALECQYFCESCGEILEEQDAAKRRRELNRILKKDKEHYKISSELLVKHKEAEAKKLEKALAKEKEEKDAARAVARALKKAEKEKEAEKEGKTTKKAAKKTTKKAAKKTTKKAAKKTTKKAAKKTTKKAEKKTTKKAAKKTTKKAEKKTTKKAEKKTTKKAAKKTTKKAAEEKSEPVNETPTEEPKKKKGFLGKLLHK